MDGDSGWRRFVGKSAKVWEKEDLHLAVDWKCLNMKVMIHFCYCRKFVLIEVEPPESKARSIYPLVFILTLIFNSETTCIQIEKKITSHIKIYDEFNVMQIS